MTEPERMELEALRTRASCTEANRQAAATRGDYHAAREHEQELSRLYSRACDLERHAA